MIGCLPTLVRKHPIIALYFESENELKFYYLEAWSRGYKTYFMLNLTGPAISTAHRHLMPKYTYFLPHKLSVVVFNLLINVKMPTIVGILTFMIRINFHAVELSWELSMIFFII